MTRLSGQYSPDAGAGVSELPFSIRFSPERDWGFDFGAGRRRFLGFEVVVHGDTARGRARRTDVGHRDHSRRDVGKGTEEPLGAGPQRLERPLLALRRRVERTALVGRWPRSSPPSGRRGPRSPSRAGPGGAPVPAGAARGRVGRRAGLGAGGDEGRRRIGQPERAQLLRVRWRRPRRGTGPDRPRRPRGSRGSARSSRRGLRCGPRAAGRGLDDHPRGRRRPPAAETEALGRLAQEPVRERDHEQHPPARGVEVADEVVEQVALGERRDRRTEAREGNHRELAEHRGECLIGERPRGESGGEAVECDEQRARQPRAAG